MSSIKDTYQHSITRAHVYIAAMITLGALKGPWWAIAAAGILSLAHLTIAMYASAREEQAS